MSMLRKATRQKAKIRLGLSAPAGFGKTYSAILIAKGISGDYKKVAIIDTENGSADLYAHLGDYNVFTLEAPFSPEKYIAAIRECEKAGMEVIIIDSISHEWEGKGGCLEIQESLGGKYQDWAKVTPRHRAFIDAMLHSPAHIITTVRRKQDYEMTKDNNGRLKVEKAGLKEVTRDGYEYEVTVNLELINDKHMAKASKDRTGLFMDAPEFLPTEKTGEQIREWCERGEAPQVAHVMAVAAKKEETPPPDATMPQSEDDALLEAQWTQVIKDQQSIEALTKFYKDNKASIDRLPGLKPVLSAKKKKLLENKISGI